MFGSYEGFGLMIRVFKLDFLRSRGQTLALKISCLESLGKQLGGCP